MNAILLVPALLVCAGMPAPLDVNEAQENPEAAAVEQAARDFVEGLFARDVDRVERGVHPSLHKLTVEMTSWDAWMLMEMDGQAVLELSRLGVGRAMVDTPEVEVEVMSIDGNIATARVDCAEFLDYAHLVKINKEWRIINLLGVAHGEKKMEEAKPEERAEIEKVVFAYVDGYYAGDAERIAGALHPRLRKVTVDRLPNGRECPRYSSPEFHIAFARTREKALPIRRRAIDIIIHHASLNVATVTANSGLMVEHLHMAKTDGRWTVVNEVWKSQRRGKAPK